MSTVTSNSSNVQTFGVEVKRLREPDAKKMPDVKALQQNATDAIDEVEQLL